MSVFGGRVPHLRANRDLAFLAPTRFISRTSHASGPTNDGSDAVTHSPPRTGSSQQPVTPFRDASIEVQLARLLPPRREAEEAPTA